MWTPSARLKGSAMLHAGNYDEGDLYKALGELRKKGVVVSISSQISLQMPS